MDQRPAHLGLLLRASSQRSRAMYAAIDKAVLVAVALGLAAPALAQNAGPPGVAPPAVQRQPPQHNVAAPRPTDLLPPLPLPPKEHTQVPPLPYGSSGYSWDPRTHRYIAEGGNQVWVPAHAENGVAVPGQWMFLPKPGAGTGR
jgi:hypothetical protein